jgi:hypothetical protein
MCWQLWLAMNTRTDFRFREAAQMQVSHLANAKLDRSTLSFARCEADSMWGKHDSKWAKLALKYSPSGIVGFLSTGP